MDLARPYKRIPDPKYKQGEYVYKSTNLYVALHIYEPPHWNAVFDVWMYNYDYGITFKEGCAPENQLYKLNAMISY